VNLCGFPRLNRGRSAPSVDIIATLAYYTVGLARPADGWSRLEELTSNAREVCEQLTREGTAVRFVRSVFVPEDETCFYLYKAGSADDVRKAARRAELTFERVCEAVAAREEGMNG